jgi:hypothetical protein
MAVDGGAWRALGKALTYLNFFHVVDSIEFGVTV